jgi:uncharacterized SAM-binding protein YcdF (DUF218 family)
LYLFVRKETWTLSFPAKLLVLGLGLILAIGFPLEIHPYLAPTAPVHSGTMIIEGWISNSFLSQAAAAFRAGRYQKLLVLQATDDEGERQIGTTAACADRTEILASYGVPKPLIGTLLYPATERDRTYHAAIAARDWLTHHSIEDSVDVVTIGPHARRSRMMFKKVFGKSFQVGIIALNDPTYDPKHWWRTSEGVRDVLGEVIAYIYAEVRYTWT